MPLEAMDVLDCLVQVAEHPQAAKIAGEPKLLKPFLTTYLTGRLQSKEEVRNSPDSVEAQEATDQELEAEETVMEFQNSLPAESRRNLWTVFGEIHPDAMAYIP